MLREMDELLRDVDGSKKGPALRRMNLAGGN
jgi:hypothetical protein